MKTPSLASVGIAAALMIGLAALIVSILALVRKPKPKTVVVGDHNTVVSGSRRVFTVTKDHLEGTHLIIAPKPKTSTSVGTANALATTTETETPILIDLEASSGGRLGAVISLSIHSTRPVNLTSAQHGIFTQELTGDGTAAAVTVSAGEIINLFPAFRNGRVEITFVPSASWTNGGYWHCTIHVLESDAETTEASV